MSSPTVGEVKPSISGNSNFRLDILGIRGIAVLMVVANHFRVPGFGAGYMGVDIFFVISGYLIIGLMFKEYLQNGKSLGGYGWISIGSFFQRRVRRILPAATFVLGVIYLTSRFIQDESFKSRINQDSIWAFLFASNINFSQQQTDYFATSSLPSPILHYWSLAVEEQFYLLMPFLFMAIVNWHGFTFAGRRLSSRPRLVLILSIVSGLSLISMIVLALDPTQTSYFDTFPRIWEFGIGGLAALVKPVTSHKSKIFLLLFRRVSFFVLLLSLLLINSTSSSILLILPTFATAAILYINQQLRFGFAYERVLTNSLLAFFGRISYSLYLWHWPVLVYAKYFGINVSWFSSVVLFAALVGLSTTTERFVERPFLRIGYVSDFHLPQIVKSRRAMLFTFFVLAGCLFIATYQPLISTYLNKVTTQRQQAFWTPPLQTPGKISATPSIQPQDPSIEIPIPKAPLYLGIFGDSSNQCCSDTGAFWPRLLAQNFNWQFADYSKPATSFINSGVGNNNCEDARNCPSVKGQLSQALKKRFDVISISSGVGDCSLARSNPEEFESTLTEIFRSFRKTYPDAVIFSTGLAFPNSKPRVECNSKVNPIISSASVASDVIYIDVAKVLTTSDQMTQDGSHLSTSGHAIIAKRVIELLQLKPEFIRLLNK
jgi:peptidoglycan/LPS O-acetylase OafA/YrhL